MHKELVIFVLLISLMLTACAPQDKPDVGGLGDTKDENPTPNPDSTLGSPSDNDNSETEAGDSESDGKPAIPEQGNPPATDIAPEPKPEPVRFNITKTTEFSALYKLSADVSRGCIISASDGDTVLKLPQILSLAGDLTIDNVTLAGDDTAIYANGFKLKITENVRSSSRNDRIDVFGGANGKDVESTDVTLLGGHYEIIYAGCNSADVIGDTRITLGGNANIGDSQDDGDLTKLTPCELYGGGKNGAVGGSSNITVSGNAVARTVSGTGTGRDGAKVPHVNITVSGGRIMNVFGGSMDSDVTDVTVNITVSGGICESVFGGCQAKSMSGNVDIRLTGGDISRRIYTGCYNDYDSGASKWLSSCKVTGTTRLYITSAVKLASGTELSFANKTDMGVYCGSRYKEAFSSENNILIFMNGCYDAVISKIGPSQNSFYNICTSHYDQIVKQ